MDIARWTRRRELNAQAERKHTNRLARTARKGEPNFRAPQGSPPKPWMKTWIFS